MTPHRNHPSARPRSDDGTAMVELVLVFMTLLPFVLAVLAGAEVLLDYHHVAGAARAAARYATRSEVDPATGTVRPTSGQVAQFGATSAAPLTGVTVTLTNPSGQTVDNLAGHPGDEVTVQIDGDTTNPGWSFISGLANGVMAVFGVKPLPPSIHLRSATTAVYE